ncbi:UNVERIFIED_CONTAM: PLP-dependent aminotransferase family protein, partial [Serratia marcescens]
GYALWLELPETINSMTLYEVAQQHGINIVPGTVFGEDQRYGHFIRLSVGHALRRDYHAAIIFLADWVKQHG